MGFAGSRVGAAIGKIRRGRGYCRRVVSSPINRLAGSFERRERVAGTGKGVSGKKVELDVSVSVFNVSCINFWGLRRPSMIGQGEQRTAYFSLEFGLYCTYTVLSY